MSDERFDHDLLQVLREAAGEEAPMSLRSRLAAITDEAPVSRRVWFSPPMRLSVAVVSVVAVLVLAFLLLPRDSVGPGPSQSPGSPIPSVEQSVTPEPSIEPTPTFEPTSEPTPPPAVWTGLAWTRIEAPAGTKSWFVVTDLIPWEGTYLAGGWMDVNDSWELAFFRLDGSQWSLLSSVAPADGWSYESTFLAPVPEGVLSIARLNAPPESMPAYELRISHDGTSWETVSDTAWAADWMDNRITNVAAGPSGVVAVATSESTGGAIVLHSSNGRAWERVQLPASGVATARDVTAYTGGFVIVGRDGETDAIDPEIGAWSFGTGRPAAWTSSDGVHWIQATVEGEALPGAELRKVIAGALGLFATGVERGVAGEQWGLGTTGWVSTDGETWRVSGELGAGLPAAGVLAGDGVRMVLIGEDPLQAAGAQVNQWVDSAAWVSDDGATWTRLEYRGDNIPRYLHCPPDSAGCGGSPQAAWVLPDGIAVSQGSGVPITTILIGIGEP
jgi:hypothetical protein